MRDISRRANSASDSDFACGFGVGVGDNFRQNFELGLHEFEAAVAAGAGGFELAVDGDLLAQFEFFAEVGAVEPEALDGGLAETREAAGDVDAGGGEAERELEEGAGFGGEERRAAHVAEERSHFAGLHFGDGPGGEAVFVAEGEMVEEVFDGFDLAACELVGDAVADALDEADGSGEGEGHWVDGSKMRVYTVRYETDCLAVCCLDGGCVRGAGTCGVGNAFATGQGEGCRSNLRTDDARGCLC